MNKENMIQVESMADSTIVIDKPEYRFRRQWQRRGTKFPVDRDILEQMFYDRDVATLFYEGYLRTDDKEFMRNVGLLKEDETPYLIDMTDTLLQRMVKVMPLNEFKTTLGKMTPTQVKEFTDYAIEHSEELKMDRIDILTKMTGKNVLKAIEFAKADQEG